jgi:hypothetical protein
MNTWLCCINSRAICAFAADKIDREIQLSQLGAQKMTSIFDGDQLTGNIGHLIRRF